MFKPLHRPAARLLALALLVISGVGAGGIATGAYAQSADPLHSIRLDNCNKTYEQIIQYEHLNITCDYQVNGQSAAVTLESELTNHDTASAAPHWTAWVWILDDRDEPFAEENAYRFNSTQNKGENADVYVEGEKILKVRIEGHVPRAHHHNEPYKNYRHETPRPTEFDILTVRLGQAGNAEAARPVTATAVAKEWLEVNSRYEKFTAETDTPERLVADAGRKLLDDGYIDIAKELLQTAEAVQQINPENNGKSKLGWYIGGGAGAFVLIVAIAVVLVIIIANQGGGSASNQRRPNTVNRTPGGPNRPAVAPTRR